MGSRLLMLKLAAISSIAFLCYLFAKTSVQISGIKSTTVSDADYIRSRCPIRLIQPEWLTADVDLFDWLDAETWARGGCVFALWLIAIVLMLRRHALRLRKAKTV